MATLMILITTCIQMLMERSTIAVAFGSGEYLSWSFYLLPSIILVGVGGIAPAMISYAFVFTFKWIFSSDIAYAETVILLSDLAIYHFVRSGRLKSGRRTIGFVLWFTLLLGPAWNILVILLEGKSVIAELSAVEYLYMYIGELPECAIGLGLLYLYMNKVPDIVRHATPMGRFYASDFENDFIVRNNSKISKRIITIITLEGVVLGVSAAAFANSLIPEISDNISQDVQSGMFRYFNDYLQDIQPPDMQNGQAFMEQVARDADENARFILNRRGLAFDLKLILLIMSVALPFIILANFYAQRYIAIPITRMAIKLKEFSDASQEEKQQKLIEVHDLGIMNDDEIGDLYETLDDMAGNITSYVDQVVREQKLEEDLRVAQKASETKSNFLNNMSHEIRTPINAVLGLDEMILREAKDEEILKYATDIQNAGKTLLGLVNDILDSSKLEAGKMDILPVEYDLSSTVNDLINMISVKAKDKGLELIVNVDETTPYVLFGDEIRIKQVITNILTNAVKYTEEGSVTLNIGYEKLSDETIGLKVSVVDTGIGIKEEDLSKLYSPFERIEEIRNRTIEGTGLGMSIVKQLLALMDTKLTVKSVYGEGSDFSFTVTQKVVKWEPIGNFTEMYERSKKSIKEYHESFRAPEAQILIVDDTQMNLTVATALLKQTKVKIDTALSGFEMLDMIKEKKYDCIFLDHRMPEMDGIETLAKMREDNEHLNTDTPVIALTANAISGARETYLSAGFMDYLSKPIDGIKFEKMLENYLPDEKVLHEGDAGFADTEEKNDGVKDASDDNGGLIGALSGTTLIDIDSAVSACGSREVFEAALKEYLAAVPTKSADIERFAADKAYKDYTVLVHALKSSSRLIGANALSALAAELEEAGDAATGGDDDAIRKIEEKTPLLLKDYRAYFDKLAPLINGDGDGEDVRPEIPADELSEAMGAIKEFAEAFDFDSADDVIEMLNDYRIPERFASEVELVKRKTAEVDQAALLSALDVVLDALKSDLV